VRVSSNNLRGVEKNLEIFSSGTKFSGVQSKNIYFTAAFHWNSVTSIPDEFWLRPHPVVSSCRSSAPPPSSVNDELLLTYISENTQQSPVTIKFPLHLWSTHVDASFASFENSVMSGIEKGFEETAATVLETKSPNCLAMLLINFSINWKYLESSCFYFPQNDSENDYRKFVLNDMFENITLFLKRANSSDQIKSSMFFSSQFYIQVFEVLHYVSQKSNRFLYHFLKTLKIPQVFFTYCWLPAKKQNFIPKELISVKLFPYSSHIFHDCA